MRLPRRKIQIGMGVALLVAAAAFIVKSLPLTAMRWLAAAVVLCTAVVMLRSACLERSTHVA